MTKDRETSPSSLPKDSSRAGTPRWIVICICCGLVAATLAVYWPSFGFGIVNLDDHGYVGPDSGPVRNGLTIAGIRWAFTTGHLANWHPLTWLSLMLDRELQPEGWTLHHINNVMLHCLNSLLLFGVFRYMTGAIWPSALVAGLFALHPAHVESVAWISERKDVLSTMFWLLCMFAYARYARARGRVWYWLATAALALGLMVKPMLVTLPCVLLLLDLWPLRRLVASEHTGGMGRDVPRAVTALLVEKAPMFALVLLSCITTYIVQRDGGGISEAVGLRIRLLNAPISYVRYLAMLAWPDDLAVYYPLPGLYGQPGWPIALAAVCAAAIAAMTTLALLVWHRTPYVTVGWLWYVGTLVPVIGVFAYAGHQGMADRYTYVPYIGLFVMLAWLLRDVIRRWPASRTAAGAIAMAVLMVLGWKSHLQVETWTDTDTLYRHALRVTRDNFRAHEMYGNHLMGEKRFAEAEAQFIECARINASRSEPIVWVGLAQLAQGRNYTAKQTFEQALALDPDDPLALFNLGWLAIIDHDDAKALSLLERAVTLAPGKKEFVKTLQELRARMNSRKQS